jgi:hypothetical protein
MGDREHTIQFLYASLQDITDTIRALDVKLHIILGVFLIPLAGAESLLGAAQRAVAYFWSAGSLVTTIALFALSISSLAAWLIGLFYAIYGIIGIGNPTRAVKAGHGATGCFHYVGHLKGNRFGTNLAQQVSRLPKTEDEIVRELTFEQMKLAYIRQMKMVRHKVAYWAATIALALTLTLIAFLWKTGYVFASG